MPFKLNDLPDRVSKPRNHGMTFVLDKGYSVREAEDLCDVCSNSIDVIKLGWGTSYVTQNLEQKIDVYKNAGIPVYFGGTLFEAYLLRNQLDAYLKLLDRYNIDTLEVSNGTIWISDENKQQIIRDLSKNFVVYSEVGSKNPNEVIPPYKWVKVIKEELEAGSKKVICEARESGTVGVFRPNGEVRSGLIEEITDQIPHEKLIFEAPQKDQQVWFINKYGSNVNLGNIPPNEVIPLETIRLGLRGDTLMEFYSPGGNELNKVIDENGTSRNKQ